MPSTDYLADNGDEAWAAGATDYLWLYGMAAGAEAGSQAPNGWAGSLNVAMVGGVGEVVG
ncbi:MAG: hypothetical protein J0M24_12660 [Verrucomicrobia bacterium]|nr:hypothetical protein [Verrucomicrobiota bacterium]